MNDQSARHLKPPATKGAISIRHVHKIYDPEGVNVLAVDDCSLEIAAGEVCMIVGPSGCGKTTLLSAIAGFHSISSGEIYLDGEPLCRTGQTSCRPGCRPDGGVPERRAVSVEDPGDNVAYGPIVQGRMSKSEARDKATEQLASPGSTR